ncbi:hypothetical protein ACTFIY_010958 [Dictyostelium cf. discoideum]
MNIYYLITYLIYDYEHSTYTPSKTTTSGSISVDSSTTSPPSSPNIDIKSESRFANLFEKLIEGLYKQFLKEVGNFEFVCEVYEIIEEANFGSKKFFIDLNSTYFQYEYLSMKSIYLKKYLNEVYGELDEDEDQFFNFKISMKKIFDDETSVESLYKVLERSLRRDKLQILNDHLIFFLDINRIDLFFDQLIKFKSKVKGNITNQDINFSDKVFITTLKVLDENSFKSFFNDYCSNQFYSFYFKNKDTINLYDNFEIVKQLISLKSDDQLSPKINNNNTQN